MSTQIDRITFDMTLLKDKHKMLKEQIDACQENYPERAKLSSLMHDIEDELRFLDDELKEFKSIVHDQKMRIDECRRNLINAENKPYEKVIWETRLNEAKRSLQELVK